MRAATLRTKIAIVERVRTETETGGATYDDLTLVDPLWARQLSRREAERYTGTQLEGVTRVVYEIRYRADITTRMEVIRGSDRLRITGIEDPDEDRRRRLHLTCERRAGDAA